MKVLVLAASVAASGCASLYEVHDGNVKVKGVPFYALAGACLQETVYQETLYKLVVQSPATDSTPATVLMEKTVDAEVFASAAMQALRVAVSSNGDIRREFSALASYSPAKKPEAVLASNTTKSAAFVDYSRVHYVNVALPWVGSASATARLNGDGTLAEASAEATDATVETLLSAVPAKEVLLGALGASGGLLPKALGAGSDGAVQLVVTPMLFKHVLTRTERASTPCAPQTPLPLNADDVNRRREAVVNASPNSEAPENAVSVTGQIVLPKKTGG